VISIRRIADKCEIAVHCNFWRQAIQGWRMAAP
jgi:hypothetical protein